MRVKCLAHEHIAMSLARSQTRTAQSGVKCTNHETTAPSELVRRQWFNKRNVTLASLCKDVNAVKFLNNVSS